METLWFLDTRVTVRVSFRDGHDSTSVLEHWTPHGDSPPLHVHLNCDEIFHLIDGEVAFRVGDKDLRVKAPATLLAPKGVPHTYRVVSASGARWLTVTRGDEFESFVRALGRPAQHEGLPERSGPPTPEQVEALTRAARQYGIEIVGPPLA